MNQVTERLKQGLARAEQAGAGGVNLRWGRAESLGCGFESGRLKEAESERSESYRVEVLLDGKRGVTECTDLADLDEMVDRAVTLARAGSVAHVDTFPAPSTIHDVRLADDRTAAMTHDEMVDGCRYFVDRLKAYDSDLYIAAGANRRKGRRVVVTSGGVAEDREATSWSLSGFCQRTVGTDILFAGAWRAWRAHNEFWDPTWIADRTLADLRAAEKQVPPPTGQVPIFLPPEQLASFLSFLEMGVNGRTVAKMESPLAGRLGEQVFSPSLTVIDDPLRDFAPGSTPIDGDGVPTRKTPIVENGVLKTFLYDLDSAGMAGAEPTGHDGCSPYNLQVAPGERSSEELLASIDDGLYVKFVMGFGQSNLINGDFSCNVALGFRVQNGEIVGRVKNTMVAGNLYEMFAGQLDLSSDRDPVLLLPSALTIGATVSAAG